MKSFKAFCEEKDNDFINSIWLELGIDINSLPVSFQTGQTEIDGVVYNQSFWELPGPINQEDKYVKIRYIKPVLPNTVRAYRKDKDGKLVPYQEMANKEYIIPVTKLAEMLSNQFSAAAAGGAGGGGGLI